MDLTAPPMGFCIKSKDGQKIETRAEKCIQHSKIGKLKRNDAELAMHV
jgi:hypothetical protein